MALGPGSRSRVSLVNHRANRALAWPGHEIGDRLRFPFTRVRYANAYSPFMPVRATTSPQSAKPALMRDAASAEVEATILVHKHRLRMAEVPVQMREREHGSSSITLLRSVYYVLKVTLALCVAMVRKYAVPDEEVKGA